MTFFNKLYKYIFRKKVQKEYDALLIEKNKIEAEIAKLQEIAAEKLKELDSKHELGLINDSDYAAKKKAIQALS
jgi:cell division protein FtsL